MDKNELLDIKKKIDTAKEENSRLEGKIEMQMNTLKEDWNCDTIEDAEKKANDLNKQVVKLDKSIKEKVELLEKEYELDTDS